MVHTNCSENLHTWVFLTRRIIFAIRLLFDHSKHIIIHISLSDVVVMLNSSRKSAYSKQFGPSFSGVVLPTQQFKHIALQWVLWLVICCGHAWLHSPCIWSMSLVWFTLVYVDNEVLLHMTGSLWIKHGSHLLMPYCDYFCCKMDSPVVGLCIEARWTFRWTGFSIEQVGYY